MCGVLYVYTRVRRVRHSALQITAARLSTHPRFQVLPACRPSALHNILHFSKNGFSVVLSLSIYRPLVQELQAKCTSITKKRKNMQISPRPLSHFPCVVSEASSATLVEKVHPCVVRRCSYITIVWCGNSKWMTKKWERMAIQVVVQFCRY